MDSAAAEMAMAAVRNLRVFIWFFIRPPGSALITRV
jgi:hypothetical protein